MHIYVTSQRISNIIRSTLLSPATSEISLSLPCPYLNKLLKPSSSKPWARVNGIAHNKMSSLLEIVLFFQTSAFLMLGFCFYIVCKFMT